MRYTVLLGGLFTSSGMFLSSFVLHDINVLYLTYGVMYGIGAAFTYSPSLAVLGHYFNRYLGKVTGFATTGSSVFTAIMPFVYNHLLQTYGLAVTLRIIAILSSLIVFCAVLYESPEKKVRNLRKTKSPQSTYLCFFSSSPGIFLSTSSSAGETETKSIRRPRDGQVP